MNPSCDHTTRNLVTSKNSKDRDNIQYDSSKKANAKLNSYTIVD